MRVRGTITGQIIELDTPTNLPDGQLVMVEISLAPGKQAASEAPGPCESGQGESAIVQAAEELRRSIAGRWRGRTDLSVRYIREDRDR